MSKDQAVVVSGVYELVHPNGDVYRVGQAVDLDQRARQHRRNPESKDLSFHILTHTEDQNALFGLEQGYTNLRRHEGHPLTQVLQEPMALKHPLRAVNMGRSLEHVQAEGLWCRPKGAVDPALEHMTPELEKLFMEPPAVERASVRRRHGEDGKGQVDKRPDK